ncbi:unnamed protein product [Phytophthora fragariaefolia]|uniref:Unnamed protein product n=1 Tax=Phytophthora fragariaefolia TaxID=1490495 RepID=A0A9W7D856_9STRA|nr:unnamed protein product [Phytophthora fragariaefolia]
MAKRAWDGVTKDTISNCWLHSGITTHDADSSAAQRLRATAFATGPHNARAGADEHQHQEVTTQPPDAVTRHSEDDGGVSPHDDQVCSNNNGAGSERESSSSEERDDSGYEDFSLESSARASDEEALTEANTRSPKRI